MEVTVRRVELTQLNLYNLLNHDQVAIRQHRDCIRRSSVYWLGLANGVEACAVGVIPGTIFAEEPYLWMIHTRICEAHPLRFMRWSRKVMNEVLDLYPSVIGLCRCDNVSAHRWLEWLGAVFDIDHPTGDHFGFRITRWPQQ